MKKIVIICILSLSLCLSQAAPADENAAPKSSSNETKANGKEVKPVAPVPIEIHEAAPNVTTTEKISGGQPAQNETKPASDKPDNKTSENKTEKTTDIPKPSEANKTTEAAPAKTTVMPSDKPANKTESAGSKTTLNPVTVSPTEAPKAVTEKPTQATRGFDGPSFIGGIILTLGLLAIGFMGFKYYKNQTERNYHTL